MSRLDRETRIFLIVLSAWVGGLALFDVVMFYLHLRAPERIPISG